jgi:uncharacterized protein (TIGR02466 family)
VFNHRTSLDLDNLRSRIDMLSQGRVVSNVGGFQSTDVDFPDVREVIQNFMSNEVIGYLGVRKAETRVHNMWANVNGDGDWNAPHTHDGAFYSGVLYVAGEPNSGDCVLLNTQKTVIGPTPYAPKLRVTHRLKPTPGMLHLFPSGVSHMVEPNRSGKLRYSISFNLTVESDMKDRMEGNHLLEYEI